MMCCKGNRFGTAHSIDSFGLETLIIVSAIGCTFTHSHLAEKKDRRLYCRDINNYGHVTWFTYVSCISCLLLGHLTEIDCVYVSWFTYVSLVYASNL